MALLKRKRSGLTDPMSVVSRFVNACNRHDADSVASCLHPEFDSIQPMYPARNFRGADQVRRNWQAIFDAEPGFRLTVLRQAAADDTVWLELHGAGRDAEVAGVFVMGVQDDRIRWARIYSALVEPLPEGMVDVAATSPATLRQVPPLQEAGEGTAAAAAAAAAAPAEAGGREEELIAPVVDIDGGSRSRRRRSRRRSQGAGAPVTADDQPAAGHDQPVAADEPEAAAPAADLEQAATAAEAPEPEPAVTAAAAEPSPAAADALVSETLVGSPAPAGPATAVIEAPVAVAEPQPVVEPAVAVEPDTPAEPAPEVVAAAAVLEEREPEVVAEPVPEPAVVVEAAPAPQAAATEVAPPAEDSDEIVWGDLTAEPADGAGDAEPAPAPAPAPPAGRQGDGGRSGRRLGRKRW